MKISGEQSGVARLISIMVVLNHSKGVSILFDPRLQVIVKNEIKSEDGRILILETDVDSEKFVLVNIYTPNNIQAQQNFFLKLAEMLRSFANAMIIMTLIVL